MTIIERNKDNSKRIREYYDNNTVLFEHTILESEKFSYSICYCFPLNIYDVILENHVNKKLINYEARQQLSGSTLKYFNALKDDTVSDMFGNNFKCKTHYVELKDESI